VELLLKPKGRDVGTVIVVPTYEDEAVQHLIVDLQKEYGNDFYMVAVDDGSIEAPIHESWFSELGIDACIIRLTNNVGHQAAISVGINYALDNLVWDSLIVMDSDGEDTPASSKLLLQSLRENEVDVVVGSRRNRVESFKFKLFYQVYKLIFLLLVGKTISFGNFMAMTPSAAKRLVAKSDTWQHLAASVMNSKLRVKQYALDRGQRYAGKSKMNFVSLVLHGIRGIMIFFDRVFIRISIFCIICALLALVAMVVIAILKIGGLASPGWFSTLWGILVLVLFQVLIVGLISMLIAGSKKTALVNDIDHLILISKIILISDKSK
jgi:glycosyltransferase involved in cell wall biosynthesis